ncbi:MAG: hypothetical protein RL304_94 [Verrucomicrobiota bacterium]|jgi:hypothetical protein
MPTILLVSVALVPGAESAAGGWWPLLVAVLAATATYALCSRRRRRELRRLRAEIQALHEERQDIQKELHTLRGQSTHLDGRIENLRFEQQRMAFLPQGHPRRRSLVAELSPALAPIQADLERVLFPGHEPMDDLDWMHKLKTRKFPYSITDEEGLVLYDLVTRLGLTRGYEIATAFGYSSFYLGLAFRKNRGSLVSVDAYVEEEQQDFIYDEAAARRHAAGHQKTLADGRLADLPEGLRFAMAGARTLGLEGTVRYEVGFSPMDVPALLVGTQVDFAFIDGSHFGEAPCADVDAVLPHLNLDRCVLVFHDTHCEAVAKAVFHAAERLGGDVHSLNTRNRLVVVSRNVDPDMIRGCRDIISRQNR